VLFRIAPRRTTKREGGRGDKGTLPSDIGTGKESSKGTAKIGRRKEAFLTTWIGRGIFERNNQSGICDWEKVSLFCNGAQQGRKPGGWGVPPSIGAYILQLKGTFTLKTGCRRKGDFKGRHGLGWRQKKRRASGS